MNAESMYEVVEQRINSKLVNGAKSANEAVMRLLNEGKLANDFIVPIGVNLKNKGEKPVVEFSANGTVKMTLPYKDERVEYKIHDNAITQLGEKMNVPVRYLKTLASSSEQWQRNLAAEILNEHVGNTSKTRSLIRTVGDQVRGVLSEKYARINSVDVVRAFLETTMKQGAKLAGGYMDDTRMALEVLMPKPFMIVTPNNGEVGVAFGARYSNSDYGDGALDYRSFFMVGICLNGAVRESMMKQIHLGARISDDIELSESTHKKFTAALVSAMSDITKLAFDRKKLEKNIAEIQKASSITMDLGQELNRLQKDGKLLKSEAEGVQQLLMANRTEDGLQGEASLWKLMQGISAQARVENPRRERELQELVGQLMTPAIIK